MEGKKAYLRRIDKENKQERRQNYCRWTDIKRRWSKKQEGVGKAADFSVDRASHVTAKGDCSGRKFLWHYVSTRKLTGKVKDGSGLNRK